MEHLGDYCSLVYSHSHVSRRKISKTYFLDFNNNNKIYNDNLNEIFYIKYFNSFLGTLLSI